MAQFFLMVVKLGLKFLSSVASDANNLFAMFIVNKFEWGSIQKANGNSYLNIDFEEFLECFNISEDKCIR